jgi:hypothetical protein
MTCGHGYLMLGEIFLHLKRVGPWLIVQRLKKGWILKIKYNKDKKNCGFCALNFS